MRGKKIEHTFQNNVEGKICNCCHQWKTLDQYNRDNSRWDKKSWRCKMCYATYDKKHREENREMLDEQHDEYRAAHPEVYRKSSKKWQANNTEKRNEIHRKSNKRRRSRTSKSEAIKDSEWLETLELFDNRCAYCGGNHTKMIPEHIIPISKGGKDIIDNLVPACASCNSRKWKKDMFTWYREQEFFDPACLERIQSIVDRGRLDEN